MTTASVVEFSFGRYDQFHFRHEGQLVEHPDKDEMVHACRVCGDPCTGQKQCYCSTTCRIHWYKDVTGPTSWEHWRNKALERDSYTCQECGFQDDSAARNLEVDHIVPVAEDPSREFDLDNLRTLCEGCHQRKEAR